MFENKIIPIVLYLIIYGIALAGAWLCLSNLTVRPSQKSAKIIKIYSAKDGESVLSTNPIDTFLETYSKKLAKYIKMNAIKKSEMSKKLYMADIPKTPEEYTAYMLSVSLLLAIVGLILLIMSKFVGGILIATSIASYIYNMKKLNSNLENSLAEFESELPRYVAYLKQAFASNSNVIAIMERYVCKNEKFMHEMTQMLADAKTSNFDSAMARLDQRVNSEKLKMVIRGLTSAYHGDDVKSYFTMLERDFTAFEINALKKSVKTIPQQMQASKVLLLFSIMMALFLPLVVQIKDSFEGLMGMDIDPR